MKSVFRGFLLVILLSATVLVNRALAAVEITGRKILVHYYSANPYSRDRISRFLQGFHSDRSPPLEERYLPLTQTHILEVPAEADLEEVTEALWNDPQVALVEIDQEIQAHGLPNDQFLNLQWALNNGPGNIGADQAWGMVNSTTNILIAVIDSGVDPDHADVSDNLWINSKEVPDNGIDDDGNGYIDDVNGYDFLNRDPLPFDDFGHGTMVFGVIGAVGNNGTGISGLAWSARIMSLKVLDHEGNSNISTAVQSIEYAIDHGVKIINMSWGYTPHGAPSQILEEAIQKARQAGILIVTSAGNGFSSVQGLDNDQDPSAANYPSSYPEDNIIAVAATNDSDQLAVFSNYGKNTVDLGAPGVEIYSTFPGGGFEYFTGTSAGAPYVTAAAALIWADNPGLNYSQVKRLILESTDSLPTLQGKTLTGGRLNVAKALLSSPSQGGTLLNTNSSLPVPSTSVSAQEQGGSGGCSLSKGTPSPSFWMGGLFLPPILFLKKRRTR